MGASLGRRVARVGIALVLVASSLPVTVAQGAADCGDVQAVWARGSGQRIDDFDWSRFVDIDLRSRVNELEVSFGDYQLGQDAGYGGFDYPAEGDLAQLAEAAINPLPGGPYDQSVAQGRGELVAYLTDRAALCPDETYVLGGWSQGAQVIGEGLFELPREVRDRIAYVALFGDPTSRRSWRW